MIRTPGPAHGGSPQKEFAVGPSLSSRPSVQIASPQIPDPSSSPDPAAPAAEEIPLLTRDEKRRILAQIVRLNPLDCFDDSGAFDIARAKHVLPACAVRHIVVHETTRTDAKGQPITQRKIHLRLVGPLSAMRLDDQLERRRESPQAPAADSDALAAEKEAEREAGAARGREYLKELIQQNHWGDIPQGLQAIIPPEAFEDDSDAGDHATPQESGRGIPAPFREAQQPGAKDTPSSPPPHPPSPPVQITPPKKVHTPPSAVARPPPLHPMSFAAQGRPRIIE